MSSQQSKENILKKIRQALAAPTENPVPKPDFSTPIYVRTHEDPSIAFAETFTKNKGEFIFCENEKEFITNLQLFIEKKNLREIYAWEEPLQVVLTKGNISFKANDAKFTGAEAGITLCECLIART